MAVGAHDAMSARLIEALRLRRGVGQRVRGLGDGLRPARPQPGDDERDARGHAQHRGRHRACRSSSTATTASAASATSSAPRSSSTGPGSPRSASRTTCSRSATASTRASPSASSSDRRAGTSARRRQGRPGVRALRAHRPGGGTHRRPRRGRRDRAGRGVRRRRTNALPPRIRHHGAPRCDHQARLPPGAVGGHRIGEDPARPMDCAIREQVAHRRGNRNIGAVAAARARRSRPTGR